MNIAKLNGVIRQHKAEATQGTVTRKTYSNMLKPRTHIASIRRTAPPPHVAWAAMAKAKAMKAMKAMKVMKAMKAMKVKAMKTRAKDIL